MDPGSNSPPTQIAAVLSRPRGLLAVAGVLTGALLLALGDAQRR